MFIVYAVMNINADRGGSHGDPSSATQARAVGSDEAGSGQKFLGAKTETEALDRALDIVVTEAEVNAALRKARGRGRIRKVFR